MRKFGGTDVPVDELELFRTISHNDQAVSHPETEDATPATLKEDPPGTTNNGGAVYAE
jgi:hypothetical protein